MLVIRVQNANQCQQIEHPSGPIVMGRCPKSETPVLVIHDDYVSRSHLRLEELPDGRLQSENLSRSNPIFLDDGQSIVAGANRTLEPPVRLTIGKTTVEIEQQLNDVPDPSAYKTLARSVSTSGRLPVSHALSSLGDAPAPEEVARWLESVITLQRSALGTPEVYAQAARGLVELVGLDLGLVLLQSSDSWETVARHALNDVRGSPFSKTLVRQAARQGQTVYQDLDLRQEQALSLQNINAAVASPIFGLHADVVGVLYGSRDVRVAGRSGRIRPLEAQVVQLLAAAVSTHLARAVATRTRVQFEQFFSPELVRELERDPNLLEGKNQEVTILCSDLRGFSELAEKLGPEDTCRLVRDMMERLSDRVVEQGGVIVDYAGDGILAMWNAPAPQEDHALRACRAALAMLTEVPGLSGRWRSLVGEPLSLGIGVNTGLAQVGNTGSSRKFKYGPHGHTVNLASRVEAATKKLRIPLLITESTRCQLPDTFATRCLGQVRLPGMIEPVALYELHGETGSTEWLARRDVYETAVKLYESRQWSKACQTLIPLLELSAEDSAYDTPTLKLMQRATACLGAPPESFDPVIDLGEK